ncbi:MAG: hypothetical protein Q8R02_18910 [Hyphomonadaceae bacterium]|nr:hypothetical protein [Hyphomonadaceae bacterium]
MRRDLGPILAIAGGIVVLAAIIWGFIAVGGPGDARARRIDDMTLGKIANIATLAQCAANTGQDPPKTIADIKALQGSNFPPDSFGRCYHVSPGSLDRLEGVDYSPTDEAHINICATFLRPTKPSDGVAGFSPGNGGIPELNKDHPEGRHCYDIRLIRPLNPIPMPDPIPASPPFR